jgi:hypothetical protein
VSTPPKDGGPAFPMVVEDQRFPDGQPIQQGFFEAGMSLRDYFAAHALAGSVANITAVNGIISFAKEHNMTNSQVRAAYCYELADAMLAERAKGEK